MKHGYLNISGGEPNPLNDACMHPPEADFIQVRNAVNPKANMSVYGGLG